MSGMELGMVLAITMGASFWFGYLWGEADTTEARIKAKWDETRNLPFIEWRDK